MATVSSTPGAQALQPRRRSRGLSEKRLAWLMVSPSLILVALVAAWAARREVGTRVVTVFPDGPQRYLDSIFNDDFCRANGLLDRPIANRPVEIAHPQALEVHGWARCRAVHDPASAVEVPA